MRRGEVWWGPDVARGERPYLLLSRDPAIDVLRKVVVVPTTTAIRDLATEVRLGRDDGMPRRCVLNLDSIMGIEKSWLSRRICELSPDRMAEVCRALQIATGC